MTFWIALLLAGLAGLVTSAMLGAHHGHARQGTHRAGADPHGHHGAPAVRGPNPSARRGAARPAGAGRATTLAERGLAWILPLLSPLTWFGWMSGAGAGGAIATALHVAPDAVGLGAAVGAAGFHYGIARPVWRVVGAFESSPAGNLEACLFQTAEAVSAFDTRGHGIVRILVDGHSEDVLARLADVPSSPRIHRGERVIVVEIDGRTGSVLVRRT